MIPIPNTNTDTGCDVIRWKCWELCIIFAKRLPLQRRAAEYTLNRYHMTSSVNAMNAMITELNWQTLTDRCRVVRLFMLCKIHCHLIAIGMPLSPFPKAPTPPTCTESMLAYIIPSSNSDYHLYGFSPRPLREWNIQPQETVKLSTAKSFQNVIVSM